MSNLGFLLPLPLQETISCLKTAVRSFFIIVGSEVIEPPVFSGAVIVESWTPFACHCRLLTWTKFSIWMEATFGRECIHVLILLRTQKNPILQCLFPTYPMLVKDRDCKPSFASECALLVWKWLVWKKRRFCSLFHAHPSLCYVSNIYYVCYNNRTVWQVTCSLLALVLINFCSVKPA